MATSLANSVVFSILLVAFWILTLVSSSLFWIRRNRHPIKSRQPGFCMFFNCVSLIVTTLRCVNYIQPTDIACNFVANHLASWYYSSFTIRAFVLWFRFEQVQEAVLYDQIQNNGDERAIARTKSSSVLHVNSPKKEYLWFSKRRYLISEKFIVLYAIITFILCFWSVPYLKATGECYGSARRSILISFLNNLILISIAIVLGYKLRKEYDYFWLKTEMFYDSVHCVSSLVVFVTVPFFFDDWREFAVIALVGWWVNTGMMIFSFTIPVYLSILNERAQNSSEDSKVRLTLKKSNSSVNDSKASTVSNLVLVLEDPELSKQFEEFLVGEFAVEHLIFYRTYKKYKADLISLKSQEDGLQRAFEGASMLFSEFVDHNAEMEINVSYICKEDARSQLDSIQELLKDGKDQECWEGLSSLFELSNKQVLDLLSKDSFIRFSLRKEVKEFFAAHKKSAFFEDAELL